MTNAGRNFALCSLWRRTSCRPTRCTRMPWCVDTRRTSTCPPASKCLGVCSCWMPPRIQHREAMLLECGWLASVHTTSVHTRLTRLIESIRKPFANGCGNATARQNRHCRHRCNKDADVMSQASPKKATMSGRRGMRMPKGNGKALMSPSPRSRTARPLSNGCSWVEIGENSQDGHACSQRRPTTENWSSPTVEDAQALDGSMPSAARDKFSVEKPVRVHSLNTIGTSTSSTRSAPCSTS
mmetsp:Transcript_148852/g.478150  ORF Transcript_148852/g.478150 Transcript_148852/m.478150 type:complete len:240 (+) Transcript_148852:159-878(+)